MFVYKHILNYVNMQAQGFWQDSAKVFNLKYKGASVESDVAFDTLAHVLEDWYGDKGGRGRERGMYTRT